MKLAALTLGALFLLDPVTASTPSARLQRFENPVGPVVAMLAAPQVTPVAAGIPEAPLVKHVAQAKPVAEPLRFRTPGSRSFTLPQGCEGLSKDRYDVVLHFHGIPQNVEKAYAETGLNAVLVVINRGMGSGWYENTFAHAGALQQTLDAVKSEIGKRCSSQAEPGRVALSSWSAGYGATYRILSHAEDAKRVDAVLLADGLHVGYENKYSRTLQDAQMAPFANFAARAKQGGALLAITHSHIVPGRYASTQETAEYLLKSQNIPVSASDKAGPRETMHETSRADHAGIHVRGFAGTTPKDHCDHLYALGQTVFPMLAERWAK